MNAIKMFAASQLFERIIIGLILFTAAIIGFESFPQWMTPELAKWFELAHGLVLAAFIVEAAIKIIAKMPRPLDYFKNGWNCFDFTLIVLSLLPIAAEFAMLGRVLRLLRVLRLINAFPELRLIVETLVRSIPSMFHIAILMGLLFFIYAVLGYNLFHEHDPTHWRDLSYAVLTLFRIVTLEDWTDVMYKAMEMSPFYAAYFVSFVIIGTFVVINLFIAVVINNLDEAKYAYLKKLEHPELHDQLMATLVSTKSSIQDLEQQLSALKTRQLEERLQELGPASPHDRSNNHKT
ncbi:ion transporter [Arenicella xantha]|uniref:Voltage-gated sodium channel n=1 Tax=Arenicella xantha TaxID=644221 RepID=A0A395JHI3_9GAMM|nr:ion transporter [Arenicella xantha]RBP49133.1 voltage-gated sodium channel [Arenicella xantha]